MPIRSQRTYRRCTALLALAPLLFPPAGATAAEVPEDPFGGLRTMSAVELAHYRGGFFTVGGWEIAFSITVDIEIDDSFRTTTWLSPLGRANTGNGPGASQQHAGSAAGSAGVDGVPALGGSASGIRIEGDEFPVHVSTKGGGLEQRVGTIDTTLVETIVSLNRVSQVVANTRNHAAIRALTTVTVDLLNHSDRLNRGGMANRGLRHLLGNFSRDIGILRH